MFEVGDQVVCVNDKFEPAIRAMYSALPVAGVTYTVRDLVMGRTRISFIPGVENGVTVTVLLAELSNPPDENVHKPGSVSEPGFRPERFVPLEEYEEEATEEVPNTEHKRVYI